MEAAEFFSGHHTPHNSQDAASTLSALQNAFSAQPNLSAVIPMVLENTGGIERAFDIYSRLLKERIVFIGGAINDDIANLIIAQLLFLESLSTEKPINLYINSVGGSVTAGFAIYDTIQYLQSPVQTICIGQAISMGALLLACGTPKRRKALPSSRIMIHQPWGGIEGQASDISIQTQEMLRIKELVTDYFVRHTGRSREVIKKDMERDFFMSPEKALAYGIIDEILIKHDRNSSV